MLATTFQSARRLKRIVDVNGLRVPKSTKLDLRPAASRNIYGLYSYATAKSPKTPVQKARKNYAPKLTRELKTELTPSSVTKQNIRPKRAVQGPKSSHVLSKNAFLVNINGKSIKLPLPDNFGNITVNSGRWYLARDDKYIPAAFLNRETILLQLLNAAYDNMASTKPKYAMQIMGKGSGKTRLLVEWICQALNNESVLHSFLNDKGAVVTDATLTPDDLTSAAKKTRRQFINSLVDTVYRQRIILYTGTVLECIQHTCKLH